LSRETGSSNQNQDDSDKKNDRNSRRNNRSSKPNNNNNNNPDNNSGDSSNRNSNNNNKSGNNKSGPRSDKPDLSNKLGKDGKLTPEERQRRFANNLCLFCGGPGHTASDCPKKASNNNKGNKPKPKG
jgi:Zinc knuckle